RPGPAEVGGTIRGVNPPCFSRGQALEALEICETLSLLFHSLQIEPTTGQHDDFRRKFKHALPSDAVRGTVQVREFVLAARDFHQFLHPVSAAVRWVYPLHAKDPRPFAQAEGSFVDRVDSTLEVQYHGICLFRAAAAAI